MQSAPAPVVHVGYACTNRCVFCAQGEQRSREPGQNNGRVESDLRCLAESGARSAAFVGGEPTLHDALPSWISKARTAGFEQIVVQTNGRRLAYPAYAQELAKTGVTGVEISMAGPREDIHDYHTRVPGSFRQTLRGMRSANGAGMRVSATLVITRSNFRHLGEHVALIARQGVSALLLSLAAARGSAHADLGRIVPRVQSVAHELAAAAELARQLGLPMFVSGLPACLVPGLSPMPLELLGPSWVELPHVQGQACQSCAWRDSCPGLETAYATRYGVTEVDPLAAGDPAAVTGAREQVASVVADFAGLGPVEPLG